MLGTDKKSSLTPEDFMDIVATLEHCKTIGELLNNAIKKLGVKHSFYQHFAAVGASDFNAYAQLHAYNAPKEIEEFYRSDNTYDRDPVIVMTLDKGRFIWLSESLHEPYIKKMGHQDLIKYSLKKVGDGLCIPLFGPDNRKGYAFVGFGKGKAEFDPVMPYQVQALCQLMHVRYCLMIKGLQKQVNLTARESEVLELISFGKTNPEIGVVLGISPRTVAVHASKIFVKLGTEDRVSAAMRAQTIKIAI